MSKPKEPEFFSRDDRYDLGLAWYASLFEGAASNQICGEASTTYTRWPHTSDAAARISKALPDVKLIYIMRHPIERAYSHYGHHMRAGVTKTFEQALEDDSIYLDCSMYMKQLDRYLQYFSTDSLLCLLTEDLKTEPAQTMNRIQEFLGMTPQDLTSGDALQANAGGAEHYVRAKTVGRLEQFPFAWNLRRLLPSSLRNWAVRRITQSPLGRSLEADFKLPPMMDSTRETLHDHFRIPNDRLSSFLGRDLSHWDE